MLDEYTIENICRCGSRIAWELVQAMRQQVTPFTILSPLEQNQWKDWVRGQCEGDPPMVVAQWELALMREVVTAFALKMTALFEQPEPAPQTVVE